MRKIGELVPRGFFGGSVCLRSSASECRESSGEALDIPYSQGSGNEVENQASYVVCTWKGGGVVTLPIRLNESRRNSVPLKKAPEVHYLVSRETS